MTITKINNILEIVENRDLMLYEHLERTSLLSFALAKSLNLNPKEKEQAYFSGLLHDIGKVFDIEELGTNHFDIGSSILKLINDLEDVSEFIKNINEKWNGEGFPNKLKEEDIPLISRIVSIANFYDNLRFVEEMSHEDAISKLRSLSGINFDPNMIEPFITIIEQENLI
jgi:Response regulator containing a CheY-like receiver domain and an HD-GYP domain